MKIKQSFYKSVRAVSASLMLFVPCPLVFKAHFWACKKLDRQQVTKAVVL